jgi:hypothetical protein
MYELEGTDFVAMTESEYLEHFGVPGMKWGVRKSKAERAEHSANKKAYKKAKRAKKASDVLLTVGKTTFGKSRQANANLYNARRKLHGKAQVSQKEAARLENNRDLAKSALRIIGGLAALKVNSYLMGHPQAVKNGMQFTSRMSGKVVHGVMNTTPGKAYSRYKKYGHTINTTLIGIGR